MTFKERKHSRVDSLNLISYTCLDEKDEQVHQGMGRTLNASEGGILFETHEAIDTQYIISMAIGLDDNLVQIKGKVIYCNKNEDQKYESGIEFLEMDENAEKILNAFIIAFNKQKQ